jgi:cell wall-associated NlpC family hydrolase
MRMGKRVSDPLPGDIVGWSYGGNSYYHVGIYIGNGKVMHSPNRGSRTTIMDVNDSWFWGHRAYTRIIPRDDSTPETRKADLVDQLLAEQ